MDPNTELPNKQAANNNLGCGFILLIISILSVIIGFLVPSVATIVCGAIGLIISIAIMSEAKIYIDPVNKSDEYLVNHIAQANPKFIDIDN